MNKIKEFKSEIEDAKNQLTSLKNDALSKEIEFKQRLKEASSKILKDEIKEEREKYKIEKKLFQEELKDQLSGYKKELAAFKEKEKEKNTILKKTSKTIKELSKFTFNVFNGAFSMFGLNLKTIFSDIKTNITDILKEQGAASYSTGTSLFTNAKAREQQMEFGLSAGQNYALTQSMSMLGMQSKEDLMYMNPAQREKFSQLMDKYNSWYDEMESTGMLQNIQEVQLEFKMFKQEVAMKFLNWVAKNKEPIMNILNGTMNFLQRLLDLLSKSKLFSGIATSSDSVNNQYSTTGYNINVHQNNNATLSNQNDLNGFIDNANTSMYQAAFNAVKAMG